MTTQCTECGATFEPSRQWQAFCCPAHKRAFHARNANRGQSLLPLLQTWRAARGSGTDATWALQQACALLDAYNAQDRRAQRSPRRIVQAKREEGWRAVDLLEP
jgi:hypothetical protein